MPVYECKRCGNTTQNRKIYENHLNKINICKSKYSDVDRSLLAQELEEYKKDPLKALSLQGIDKVSTSLADEELRKRGFTASSLYQKVAEMGEQHAQDEEQINHLNQNLTRVLEEVRRKAPLMDEARLDHERLLKSHESVSDRLLQASDEIHSLQIEFLLL